MRRNLTQLARKVYRQVKPGSAAAAHWRGVYGSATEVPEHGPGFASDAWIAATRRDTQRAIDDASTTADGQLLATVVALTAVTDRPVRILDFGGGMGIGYLRLRHALAARTALDYHVVEGQRVCDEGRKVLAAYPEVQFRATMPDTTEALDIVHACSALQYVDDYQALLGRFCAYRPSTILLADVPAGGIPSFWTAQLTVPGSAIRYHFLGEAELVGTMREHGYRLVVHGSSDRVLDTESLPPEHRIDRTRTFVFVP